MSLKVWNSPSDPYDHEQLADNFLKLDVHDHSQGRGAQIGAAGIQNGAITAIHIAPGAITSGLLGAGSVTAAKLEPQQAWQTIALAGGFTGNVTYYKDSLGLVHFRGMSFTQAATVASGTTLVTMPAGYRPGATFFFQMFNTTTANLVYPVSMTTAGVLALGAATPAGAATFSFGPICYRAEN